MNKMLSLDRDLCAAMDMEYPDRVSEMTEKCWRILLTRDGNLKHTATDLRELQEREADQSARETIHLIGDTVEFAYYQQEFARKGVKLLAHDFLELKEKKQLKTRQIEVAALPHNPISGDWMIR